MNKNKLCTYSNCNIGYAEAKCKKLYNQEYVDLLETRNSLLTKALSLLFRQFDNCLESGLLEIHPEKINEFKKLKMQSMIFSEGGAQRHTRSDDGDQDTTDWDTDYGDSSEVDLKNTGPEDAWINLQKNKDTFVNKETGKLNVNQVIYSIVPTNVDMAVKSLNFTSRRTDDLEKIPEDVDLNSISSEKTASEMYEKYLSKGYVNSETLFTSDHSKEGIPEDFDTELLKRKRRNPSAVRKENNTVNNQNQTPTSSGDSKAASDKNISVSDGIGLITSNTMAKGTTNLNLDNAADELPYSQEAHQWIPKMEYGHFDLLEPFSAEFRRHPLMSNDNSESNSNMLDTNHCIKTGPNDKNVNDTNNINENFNNMNSESDNPHIQHNQYDF